ncbi:MAG: hypothetical protein Q4G09_03925 [Clostridia bacterium]|nr:hypothetical protein [Clostridia bacterium]
MRQGSFSKKRIIHIYIIVLILSIIFMFAAILMFTYHVEGEKNLPFNLKKINVISTAESSIAQDEQGAWNAKILQKNDIFFTIEKNSKYKKEEAIKKISFENFRINKLNENMIVSIYRPINSAIQYNYSEEYKVNNALEYIGGLNTNVEVLEINNQGGLIGFSIIADNIGEYVFAENEKLPSDGRLLAKANVNLEDIKFQVYFDLIIETEGNRKFKSNIKFDLPIGNILENGVGTLEDTELKNVVFKRF